MNAITPTATSRRGFLVIASAAGLGFGFARAAGLDPVAGARHGDTAAQFEPTIWFGIDKAGIVTVNVVRAEMGQHVGTAIARIVADELETPWDKVRINHVDTDPKWGDMSTGGSWSVWQSYAPMSQAGAAGRIAMIEAGARLMKLAPGDCTARGGMVSGASGSGGGKSIGYGEIAASGIAPRRFSEAEMKAMPIKPIGERRLIGKKVAAADIPAKTNGSAVYGIDARLPGMVYARPSMPPTRYGSKAKRIDDSAARAVAGYLQYVVLADPSDSADGWVLAIASSAAGAIAAADALKVEWDAGAAAKVSEKTIQDHGLALVADPAAGALVIADPGVDAAFEAAAKTVDATYTTASALHFQLEPVNALAAFIDGRWEIHTGNQWQSLNLPIIAKSLGVTNDKVIMRTYLLGGGFGRRLNGDYAVPAALAAKALGKPVKLVMTRADDVRFDSFRSPSVQTIRIALDAGGKVTAMDHAVCAGWPTQVLAPGFLSKGSNGVAYDGFAINGADHWYNVGAHRVRAVLNDVANASFRPGWLRSVGPGFTNWALECGIDEAAHAAGIDPVALRLTMLDGSGKNAGPPAPVVGGALRQAAAGGALRQAAAGGALRQAAVVRRAIAMAGWGQKLPAGTGLGIATSFGQERDMPTWTVCVARVRADAGTGAIKVEKLSIAIDAGTIVDPDGALAQVEGAALWGMSLALFEGTTFTNGEVADTNLDTYTPLRIGDVPELDIVFIDSAEPPVGLGEPASTVVGPAIANAIFAATGKRLRHLPMRPDDLKRA
jgi:CO/xanthine dehydrogenase Mo-binding subunit